MKRVADFLLFVLANAFGFFAAPISYNAAVMMGWFSPLMLEGNEAEFNAAFFTGTMLAFLACALISAGFFMTDAKMRALFLLAPALLPLAYGFNVLNDFSSLG